MALDDDQSTPTSTDEVTGAFNPKQNAILADSLQRDAAMRAFDCISPKLHETLPFPFDNIGDDPAVLVGKHVRFDRISAHSDHLFLLHVTSESKLRPGEPGKTVQILPRFDGYSLRHTRAVGTFIDDELSKFLDPAPWDRDEALYARVEEAGIGLRRRFTRDAKDRPGEHMYRVIGLRLHGMERMHWIEVVARDDDGIETMVDAMLTIGDLGDLGNGDTNPTKV